MDYKQFSPSGPVPAPAAPGEDRWWDLEGPEQASAITRLLDKLLGAQQDREQQLRAGRALYGNRNPIGPVGFSRAESRVVRGPDGRIGFNVVQSAIDTVTSKIAKNKPRPYFLTSGGNYRQQRKAKKLNQFVDGIFYECGAYDLGPLAFRDGAVWGDGLVHVFERFGRVAFERVLPGEIYVDEIEAQFGEPKSLHRVKQMDAWLAASLWKSKKAAILDARTKVNATSRTGPSDLVVVRESWHLPSGPTKASGGPRAGSHRPGLHVVSIDGHVLFSEPWQRDEFPFARFRWSPRLVGYWSQGVAEQLQGIQLEINKLLRVIQRSFELAGTFKLLRPMGSKVSDEKINNDIGAIIDYAPGFEPKYVVPPAVQPEIYGHFATLVERAYEQVGVSQLSAGSQKPAGLDAAVALREFSDIESDRFQTVGKEYERFYLDLARLSIATAKEIAAAAEGKAYPVRVPGKRGLSTVDWKEIELEEDAYVMQCFPVSSLPREPAGKLATIKEMMQAGLIDQRRGRALLDFPDLEAEEAKANAQEQWISKMLDAVLDEEEPQPPDADPRLDLALAREMTLQYYAEGQTSGLEPERLEILRGFLDQIAWLEQQALAATAALTAAPMPGASTAAPLPGAATMAVGAAPGGQPLPLGVPQAPPVSELLPNVPGPGAVQ